MITQEPDHLEELLSLETAPAEALGAEQRLAIASILESAQDEEALAQLAARATDALQAFGDNLRARYATALCQESTGESEEAGVGYHHLSRELARHRDWAGARELAIRALPLRADSRVVRLLLEAWAHLSDEALMEDDLALAQSLCPDSPDLLWLESQRADGEGRPEDAQRLACEALNQFVLAQEADRAEEPLLRVLETDSPAVYAELLSIIPRMACTELAELLDMTLELAADSFSRLSLQSDLAHALEGVLLQRKGFEHLRPTYAHVVAESLGGAAEAEKFVSDCGLGDPDVPLERALQTFREMHDLRPGAFVEHHDFGVGRISAHDGEFVVLDFEDKPGHRMALEIGRRSLRPLPEGCLRAVRFSEPETIAREIESDPVGLLVRALSDLGGEASARDLRDCLAGSTIPEDDWSAWWKRAREAAQNDPRLDISQAFRQVYRLPGESEDEQIELPPLPAKGGAQSAVTMIERLLRQHPELDERAKARYADELAQRAISARAGDGVPAVPTLMRWLPERADEWRHIANIAFRREPGVAGGITAEQQTELLELGLAADAWQDAALTALASRFPTIRDQALAALRTRLSDGFLPTIREALLARDPRPTTRLAIVRLGLAGRLADEALSPWEILVGALTVISSDPPPKTRHAALDLLDPQERLAGLLRDVHLDDHIAERFHRAVRDLATSETGLAPLVLLLAASGHEDLSAELRAQDTTQTSDPIDIHFDPGVTLMTRITYEQNVEKIRDLQHQLATTIPREIGAARELGDLSENAEYHAARERQGIADVTLRSLRSQMDNASVIEDLHFPEGVVAVGTEVVIRDLSDNHARTLWLLGRGDSVQDKHVINYRAPLGQALVGKKPGDIVDFEANGENQRLEIVSVEGRLP